MRMTYKFCLLVEFSIVWVLLARLASDVAFKLTSSEDFSSFVSFFLVTWLVLLLFRKWWKYRNDGVVVEAKQQQSKSFSQS